MNDKDRTFAESVENISGEPVSLCFGCQKCSSGCPVNNPHGLMPHRLMHMIKMGFRDQVLQSPMLWLCTGCQSCSARCPNGIRISNIISALKKLVRAENIPIKDTTTLAFYDAFLECIEKKGRVSEILLLAKYNWKSGEWIKQLRTSGGRKEIKLGMEMLQSGKLPIFGERLPKTKRTQVRDLFRTVKVKEKSK